MHNVVVRLPVKSHVANYIQAEYRSTPILLDRPHACIFQNKLLDLLKRPERFYRYNLGPKYNAALYFELPPWIVDTAGIDITPEKIVAFNRFVELAMRERLFIILDVLSPLDAVNNKDIINSYIDHNNLLEAGMNYDALKKAYYRYRSSNTDRVKPWQITEDMTALLDVPSF